MLSSCLESWVVTLTVRLAVALSMRQTFANRSGVTPDGFLTCEGLKKAAQYSISSKGVVIFKIIGELKISQSCRLTFVLPTAPENFDQDERSFNLLTKILDPRLC